MPSPEANKDLRLVLGAGMIFLLCVLSYLFFDREVIHHFQSTDPYAVTVFRYITQLGDSLYALVLGGGLYLICSLRLRFVPEGCNSQLLERWKLRGFFLFTAVAGSGLLADLLKFIFGRARPTKFLNEDLYGFFLFETSSRMHSFPSGHSNTVVAIALVLWYLWPRSWPLGLTMVAGVTLSRVVLLKHYPSDVLAGAYLAVVTTFYLFRFLHRRYPVIFSRG